jgi:hypothetical protein
MASPNQNLEYNIMVCDLIEVVGGRNIAAVSNPTPEGGTADYGIQVGPAQASGQAQASATQGVRLNWVLDSVARGQRRMQSSLWAVGKAICAVGRTLPEEWEATHQYG